MTPIRRGKNTVRRCHHRRRSWLGFDWGPHQYFASTILQRCTSAAVALIERGHAYVDSQTRGHAPEPGTLTEPGRDSPHRSRSVAATSTCSPAMKAGEFPTAAHVRAPGFDMASPNQSTCVTLPSIASVTRTITNGRRLLHYPIHVCAPHRGMRREHHAFLCTLEFEDQRPFYDWLLQRLAEAGLVAPPLPQQYRVRPPQSHVYGALERKLMQLVRKAISMAG